MKPLVLCLLHLPPPDYGVTLFNQKIISGLLSEEFSLKTLAINTSRRLEDIERFSFSKIAVFLCAWFNLLGLLSRSRYALCYFSITPTGAAFYRDILFVGLLKAFRVKILYHLHGKGISRQKGKLTKALYKWCFRNACLIQLSPVLFYDIQDYARKQDVFVLPNGIEDACAGKFSDCRGARSREHKVNILFLSNMVKSKGVFDLLEAASIIKAKGYNFRLVFAGAWFDITAEEFDQRVKEFRLENETAYLGFKKGVEKDAIFMAADIFVYPTRNDTFPLVLLEALHWGLPVISTREGGIPDIIDDNFNGFLISPGDVKTLAERIEVLINDRGLRERMGFAGREKFLSEYTFDRCQNRLRDIFNKVVKLCAV